MKFDFGAFPARIGKGLQKLFGSANQRALAAYAARVREINERAGWAESLDDAQVRAAVAAWRDKVRGGDATLDDALVDMFALTRVAAQRRLGMRHFDVQLIGGMVLHEGKIAEMATGEGKTLAATLAAALNALAGKGVYIVTVNDYLARRDCEWMAPVFEYLGLNVASIQSQMPPSERRPAYESDILYGTNNEFGFDYLRDNMKWSPEEQVQKRLSYAIVDEVDSILVDEARTPLIISGPPEGKAEKFVMADRIARKLKPEEHFEIKEKEHQALLNEAGIELAEELVGVGSFYSDPANMDWPHLLEQSLRAHHIYKLDKDYVVAKNDRNGQTEVIIVDEFTGRLMVGRRWSDGLHQAVEAKEGLSPQEESQTLATITLQNYFRMFDKLAGMTGTAMTEAAEFSKIYKLDVVVIPTNREMVRKDIEDLVYLDGESKLQAIVEDMKLEYERGRPVLLGTTSIEKSEKISAALHEKGVPHNVLNAKQHAREAEIVAQAGSKGAVTVATNMAGRGTDIVLGGNPDRMFELEMRQKGEDPASPAAQARLAELKQMCTADGVLVKELGGLLVVGTERHEARRIDNQLRGRCGRQGDPGESRFYLSFDDDLMRIFARDWIKTMMERLGLKAGERIESGMVSRGIERAQKKVEARNFDIRKNLIEYDEVMDKQRKFVYSQRQDALEMNGLNDKVLGMFEELLEPLVERYAGDKDEPVQWAEIRAWVTHKAGDQVSLTGLESIPRDGIFEFIMERLVKGLAVRKESYGEETWDRVQQFLLMDAIDSKWKDHLHAMEVLKAGIGLRGYAQIDPKNEYKKEGWQRFQMLKEAIAEQVAGLAFRVELQRAPEPRRAPQQRMPQLPPDPVTAQAMVEAMIAAGQAPPEVMAAVAKGGQVRVRSQVDAENERRETQRKASAESKRRAEEQRVRAAAVQQQVGRNDPCPCGSGKKYKKCHGGL